MALVYQDKRYTEYFHSLTLITPVHGHSWLGVLGISSMPSLSTTLIITLEKFDASGKAHLFSIIKCFDKGNFFFVQIFHLEWLPAVEFV